MGVLQDPRTLAGLTPTEWISDFPLRRRAFFLFHDGVWPALIQFYAIGSPDVCNQVVPILWDKIPEAEKMRFGEMARRLPMEDWRLFALQRISRQNVCELLKLPIYVSPDDVWTRRVISCLQALESDKQLDKTSTKKDCRLHLKRIKSEFSLLAEGSGFDVVSESYSVYPPCGALPDPQDTLSTFFGEPWQPTRGHPAESLHNPVAGHSISTVIPATLPTCDSQTPSANAAFKDSNPPSPVNAEPEELSPPETPHAVDVAQPVVTRKRRDLPPSNLWSLQEIAAMRDVDIEFNLKMKFW